MTHREADQHGVHPPRSRQAQRDRDGIAALDRDAHQCQVTPRCRLEVKGLTLRFTSYLGEPILVVAGRIVLDP
jgi:hypothetical protein